MCFCNSGKYNSSLFYVVYYFFKDYIKLVKIFQNSVLITFVIFYAIVVIKLLLQKQIRFYEVIRKYHVFLWLFVFVLITNYNTWYMLWLFPNVLYLRGRAIKRVLNLATGSQVAMQVTYLYLGEYQILGFVFLGILIGIVVAGEVVVRRKRSLAK